MPQPGLAPLHDFIGLVQLRFLQEAARRSLVATPPEPGEGLATWAEACRQSLLARNPGFGDTLLGWPSRIPSAFAETAEGFTAEAMGRCYEAFLGREARQSQGTFYTASPMIRRLLAEPLSEPQPRLLDPAMGCGAFLSEALAMRDPGDARARWDFACHSLFGVDRDPVAREIAVLALWLQIGLAEGDPRRLRQNLRTGDSLLEPGLDPSGIAWERGFPGPMGEGGFTAVVGNPPFVNIERLSPEARALYRVAFPTSWKRFDLFVLMAEKALDLVRPGGWISLVLPHPFMTQAYGEPLRRRFLAETTLLRIEEQPFAGASVRTILLTARKAAPGEGARIALTSPAGTEWLPQAPLIRLPEARIPSRGGEAFAVAHRAFERGVPLGRVAFATWGVRGVPIGEFHRDQPDHAACRRMLKGEGIEPYRVSWGGKWLRYEPERLYRPLFPELFEGEKLVLRKVSGTRGLVAAQDREGYYTDDSVLCCQLRRQLAGLPERLSRRFGGILDDPALEAYDLPILLAVLNSRLGRLVFELLLGNGLNVYPAAVMRMPLPPIEPVAFARIRELVARREQAPEEASEVEAEIEDVLAALFGMPGVHSFP